MDIPNTSIVACCRRLLLAYRSGALGQTRMPEDSHPDFPDGISEGRLAYFTLPMALNYQRDSYKLWEAAVKTWTDPETRAVFTIEQAAKISTAELRNKLARYRLALQPNKHTATWQTITQTVRQRWGSLSGLIKDTDNDFLRLRQSVQVENKKGFPYLSGSKIFNYWAFILMEYGKVPLKNGEYIDIAPDTHVIQCSVRLGVITDKEATTLAREQISERWRAILAGSGITPIQMHPPLWFWSRNGFGFEPK